MPEIVADPPLSSCYHLFSGPRIQEHQQLAPDSLSPQRPRGIRNPKRRVPDLVARPLSARALSELLDRKPHLLRPLAEQLLPPPLAPISPAARLRINLSSLQTAEDVRQALSTVLMAIARGEITPGEGALIAERVEARLRPARRLARLERRRALQSRLVRTPAG